MINFEKAMARAGVSPRDPVIADGILHRFHVQGDKTGTQNGWYILFDDGLPTGCFGSWKTGDKHTWCEKSEHELTASQRLEHKRRITEARKAREAEEQARRNAAREKALHIWKVSQPALDTHPYLVKKNVSNHGLRLHKDALVIPMRDSSGILHSLQFIDNEGNKRFLSGGRKKGCYFPIGAPTDTLCIAEGYATAASVFEATGYACAVAFDAENLLNVAKALRSKFSHIEITLCADNDTHTEGNPGLTKAREAATSVGALLAIPPCHGDFNDYYTGVQNND